jgi:hypothetical protein
MADNQLQSLGSIVFKVSFVHLILIIRLVNIKVQKLVSEFLCFQIVKFISCC